MQGKTTEELSSTQLLDFHREMLRIRRFEERVLELFTQGKIPGFSHTYIGEEAIAVGVCAALRRDDYVASTHRGHGHGIAKGADMKRMMAELFARVDGLCHGRSGSMHVTDMDSGILPFSAIVGASLPLAAGAAYAAQVQGTDGVAVSFFGDGASGHGTFHETLNLAALWKLPVVFVCEVNQWVELMPASSQIAGGSIEARAAGYGIPGMRVDGNDVIAVYKAAQEAVDRARAGEGPSLIEAMTDRWYGHYIGDPQKYRDSADIEAVRGHDPILRLGRFLLEQGACKQAELDEILKAIDEEVEESVRFAEASPMPDPSELTRYVYAPD